MSRTIHDIGVGRHIGPFMLQIVDELVRPGILVEIEIVAARKSRAS
jgi:hypothetical protein